MAWLGALALIFLLPELPGEQTPGASAVVVQPNVADFGDWDGGKAEALQNQLFLRSMELALVPGAPSRASR